jgi:hypothetical protein
VRRNRLAVNFIAFSTLSKRKIYHAEYLRNIKDRKRLAGALRRMSLLLHGPLV